MSNSEQEPSTLHAESDNGYMRWWRPDLVYKDAKSRTEGTAEAVFSTMLLVSLGWFFNGLVDYSREKAKEAERERERERKRVKREERWRMEAREEYRNGQR